MHLDELEEKQDRNGCDVSGSSVAEPSTPETTRTRQANKVVDGQRG